MRHNGPASRTASSDRSCFDWEQFPATRYLGSKRKLLGLLAEVFERLEFETALDPFSGTGSVAYLLKCLRKKVTACDALHFCAICSRALVKNSTTRLDDNARRLIDGLPDPDAEPGFIELNFADIFFEDHENRFIDGIVPRIQSLATTDRDLAFYALYQACLAKRPYNLFHRANISMRRRDVERSFGNKATWDRPFGEHFVQYAAAADQAVFDSGQPCEAFKSPWRSFDPQSFDLVYLDPPYVSNRGNGVDYLDYYHFLEGITEPDGWAERILHKYKHKPLRGRKENPFSDPSAIRDEFRAVIRHFSQSKLVVSYRSDGIPSIAEITDNLTSVGKKVEVIDAGQYTYALSRNRKSREIVIIGL